MRQSPRMERLGLELHNLSLTDPVQRGYLFEIAAACSPDCDPFGNLGCGIHLDLFRVALPRHRNWFFIARHKRALFFCAPGRARSLFRGAYRFYRTRDLLKRRQIGSLTIHTLREVHVKKVFAISQLLLVAGVVIYGTVCLYRGDFSGSFATLPFLFFYYVWFVAKKARSRRNDAEEEGPSDP